LSEVDNFHAGIAGAGGEVDEIHGEGATDFRCGVDDGEIETNGFGGDEGAEFEDGEAGEEGEAADAACRLRFTQPFLQ